MVVSSRSASRRVSTVDQNKHPRQRFHKHVNSIPNHSSNPSISPENHKVKKRRLNPSEEILDISSAPKAPKLSASDTIVVQPAKKNGNRPRVTIDNHEYVKPTKPKTNGSKNAQPHKSQEAVTDKRVLRSADGTSHSESELAYFFSDYEEYVFGPTKPPPRLNVNSTLFITERKPDHQDPKSDTDATPKKAKYTPRKYRKLDEDSIPEHDRENTPTKPLRIEKFNLDSLQPLSKKYKSDPLTDDLYIDLHKKGERKEKSFRIKQHDWAIHEKAMLGRLSEQLKGPDWLRTMGISGITETEKKAFEPKRDRYIKAVQSKINQFNEFKEKEKNFHLERQESMAKKGTGGSDGTNESHEEKQTALKLEATPTSTGSSGNIDDAEASALQLQQEAKTATRLSPPLPPIPQQPPENDFAPTAEKPFVSFFEKPYIRDAAIGKHRRGRTVRAFGLPVPELEQRDFELPADIISPEDFAAHARKRRRLKRESKDGICDEEKA